MTNLADRELIAVIGDEDTCVGFLLGGIGEITGDNRQNFMVVTQETPKERIEDVYENFMQRRDIGIILINEHIAEQIRPSMEGYNQIYPVVLEIPSKDHPYDGGKDLIMTRIHNILGSDGGTISTERKFSIKNM